MALLQLEGNIDNRDEVIANLRDEVRRLRDQCAGLQLENEHLHAACRNIKRVLSPLFEGMKLLFGEFDGVMVEGDRPDNGSGSLRESAYALWKQRMPGIPSRIIDVLLKQSGLNTTQLAIAVGCDRTSIPQAIFKLNKAGLISKNGNNFSLKQL